MRLLLDSQVLVLTMSRRAGLPARVSAALADPQTAAFVSAATPYELEWKKARGKLRFPDVADWPSAMRAAGYVELPITFAHAQIAARLPPHHRDPWDRILIAQAQIEGLILVTSDQAIASYAVQTLW